MPYKRSKHKIRQKMYGLKNNLKRENLGNHIYLNEISINYLDIYKNYIIHYTTSYILYHII